VKILIVDDHPLIREGLANVLGELESGAAIAQAEDADAALAAVRSDQAITLVLLDLFVPGAEGLSLLDEIRAARPELPVVVLSAHDERDQVLAAIDAGAMGFISKRSHTQVLVNALRLVLAGGVYLPPQVLTAMADAPVRTVAPPANGAASGSGAPRTVSPADLGLTERQADVLALLVQGKPNKLICRELDLAEGTVKTHITAILRALNVSNRTQALFALSRLGVQLAPFTPRSSANGASSHAAC
jgi:DNA-binding NarL/FixJ family response regulator